MTGLLTTLGTLGREQRGAMVVETAIILPTLLLMSLGSFEVSRMVARQNELETAAAETASIVLSLQDSGSTTTTDIEEILRGSTGLTGAGAVTVRRVYRCGVSPTITTNLASCGTQPVSTFVEMGLTDTYTPVWCGFGVGSPVTMVVNRKVQLT